MMPETAIDPAFPGTITAADGRLLGGSMGMTLLDYFAAAALTGLLSRHSSDEPVDGHPTFSPCFPCVRTTGKANMAEMSYGIAQAMIIERERLFLDQVNAEA